jgi:pimeloyl-ACP methyl ester carboxylesterase
LIRSRATGPERRIGSLVFNFGGPGASGVDDFALAADGYRALRERYDLVSFDPRGVGRSAPVTCIDDRGMDRLTAMDDSPDTPAEERALATAYASYARGCRARSGAILPHVGTAAVARDLDAIRAALGDRRLHYFGMSYGTWLGGAYAHQRPRTVGRAVLDGAVDATIGDRDRVLDRPPRSSRPWKPSPRTAPTSAPPNARWAWTPTPSSPPSRRSPASAPDAAPILVLGTTGDPATPYAWASALTRELGGKATLLTLKGEGHGAYATGDRCVRAAVDGYLLDGTVPEKETTCG